MPAWPWAAAGTRCPLLGGAQRCSGCGRGTGSGRAPAPHKAAWSRARPLPGTAGERGAGGQLKSVTNKGGLRGAAGTTAGKQPPPRKALRICLRAGQSLAGSLQPGERWGGTFSPSFCCRARCQPGLWPRPVQLFFHHVKIIESQNHFGWKRPLRSSRTINATPPTPPPNHGPKNLNSMSVKRLQGW